MRAIDLFAGAGGFTTGAAQAGVEVVWAANHWPAAVKVHAANHPTTDHVCQDLHQADWSRVPAHDLMLASPACTGHSRSRGKDRPHHDAARSTAWAVVSAAEMCDPAFILVENVPEFAKWTLFPEWSAAMRKLGYSCALHHLDAADFGVAQHRRRLFLVFTKSRAPLRLALPKVSTRAASEIVDFTTGRWSNIARPGRAANTLRRIEAGRQVHGARFAVAYYGSTKGGHSLSEPLGTLTTHDRYALIDNNRMRMLTVDEIKALMGFPESYKIDVPRTTAVKLLGNAVVPQVGRALCEALQRAA